MDSCKRNSIGLAKEKRLKRRDHLHNHGNNMKSEKRNSQSYNVHNSHRHVRSYKNQIYFCILKTFLNEKTTTAC